MGIEIFSQSSGCRLNISKSEAIWIGSKKGTQLYPFSDKGLKWNKSTFKTLGIHFSLNIKQLYDLNHMTKLKSIENTLNCWRARKFIPGWEDLCHKDPIIATTPICFLCFVY